MSSLRFTLALAVCITGFVAQGAAQSLTPLASKHFTYTNLPYQVLSHLV